MNDAEMTLVDIAQVEMYEEALDKLIKIEDLVENSRKTEHDIFYDIVDILEEE